MDQVVMNVFSKKNKKKTKMKGTQAEEEDFEWCLSKIIITLAAEKYSVKKKWVDRKILFCGQAK